VEAVNELDEHKADFVGHVIRAHVEHDDAELGSKRSDMIPMNGLLAGTEKAESAR
jgi:hypothetical protein